MKSKHYLKKNEATKYEIIKIILLWFTLTIPTSLFVFSQMLGKMKLNIFLFLTILLISVLVAAIASQYITNKYIFKR